MAASTLPLRRADRAAVRTHPRATRRPLWIMLAFGFSALWVVASGLSLHLEWITGATAFADEEEALEFFIARALVGPLLVAAMACLALARDAGRHGAGSRHRR